MADIEEEETLRESTIVLDFKSCPIRPSLKEVMSLLKDEMEIPQCILHSVQMHHVRNCVLVTFTQPYTAERHVELYNLKLSIKHAEGTFLVPIYMEDDAIEVRIHDLPQNINPAFVKEQMSQFGEVLHITDDTWKKFFPGLYNGVKILRMRLTRPIPSYVTFKHKSGDFTGRSLVTYEGQILTCQWCGKNVHYGTPCEKSDASKRNPTFQQPKKTPVNEQTNTKTTVAVPNNKKTIPGTYSAVVTGNLNAVPKNSEQKIPVAETGNSQAIPKNNEPANRKQKPKNRRDSEQQPGNTENSDTTEESSMDIERVGEDSGSSGAASPPRKKLIPRATKVQQ